MYLVTANEMQTMDRETIESFGIPGQVLMENAGRGATRMFLDKFPGVMDSRVGVLAGRGNNGGDGFVIARYLAQYGVRVCVYLLSEKSKVKGDAEANLKLLEPLYVPVFEVPDKASFERQLTGIKHQEIWVDAILGTGLSSPVRGYFKEVIEFVNQCNRPVFAVDIPSGLDSDTGKPLGVSVKAHATATFGFAKIGHVLYPGKDYTGDLGIIDIGIPPHIVEQIGPGQRLLTPDYISNEYLPRPSDAHKGTTGHLMIVAGSRGKTGAAAMTAISAIRAGAGLVTLGIPASLNPVLESQVLEAMTVPLYETDDGCLSESSGDTILSLLEDKRCLAIGPGIGTNSSTKDLIVKLIKETKIPLVIDADGLNILAENMGILKKVRVPVILTP
ncbi:MAG: NAD(P)H-hydrate epimerase, partial [Desulfobacterales bacterium]|nr:NAD(P)H-hydrate epimerase [Desulfobacterales bacterium]